MKKSYALITGASSGIGWELSLIMGEKGHSLILVARRKDKLEELKKIIQSKSENSVVVIEKDLTHSNAAQELFNEIEKLNLQVDILVNNAGFGSHGLFENLSPEKIYDMIHVNILALAQLTRLFLPSMIQNKKGRILNVASVAGFLPGPMMAVYYATKAFVLHFSEAIQQEVKNRGITVTTLCPGPTASEFQAVASEDLPKVFDNSKMPSSKVVAQCGYRAMMKGKGVVIHGRGYGLGIQLIKLFPRVFVASLVRKIQEERA